MWSQLQLTHFYLSCLFFLYCTRLRTYYLFYWFILCTRGYIESKKKKSLPHHAPIRLYIYFKKNEKGWDLAKIKLEYSDKTHVLSWNFFQRLPNFFLWPLRTFSRYVYALLKYIFPSVTKSWPHGAAIRLHLCKSEKSWYFEQWNSKLGWGIRTKPTYW